MPEQLEKADPSAFADGVDSPVVDQEEFEVEEEEEEEEEEGLEGEEKEVVEVEEMEGEEEDVDEFEEEEDEGGDSDVEEVEELEEDDVDREQEEIDEGEEEAEENEEQEAEEVDDGDGGEEEIEEEEMVVEDESREKGEEVAGVISTEAASAVPEDAMDLFKMVKSEVHDQDQNSLSFTARDWNVEKHHAYDHSKMFSININEFNDTSIIGNRSSSIMSENITFEENGIPETLLGETCKGIQLEKEITNESPKYVKNSCLETQGSLHSLDSDNARLLQPLKNDFSVDGGVRNESEIVNFDVSEKGESHLQKKNESQMLEDSTLTYGHTPQRRPRSSSPGSEPDKMNKRLANMCVFYARGWCIKGNSCKFLHQKDGVNKIEQQTKEDTAGHNRAADSLVTTASDEISERSKVSSAVLESNPKGSSGCNSLLQRALVRTYGTGSHVTSQLDDHYDIHTKREFRQSDHFQAGYTSTREEYKKPFGKMNHFESIVGRQPDDAFLFKRHLIEGKLINEVNMEDSPYDITISGRTNWVDAFASDSKHYSGTSSISSILHQNSNSPSAYGRTEGNAIGSAQSHFLKQESYNSHSLAGSLNSGLGGSFQLPELDYRLSRTGASPTSDSIPKTEYLEGPSLLDLDRKYHGSGSISLTRDSYHSRPELRNMIHHNIPGDLTSRQTAKIQYDAWEPSQPFRSSLAIATKSISSPSQYDPILDSIEPVTANARDCFQTSQITSFQNASFMPTKAENAISWEGMLTKNVSLHDSNAHAAADEFFTSIKLEGGNSSLRNNEKAWIPDRLVERSNNKDTELGSEWKTIDKGRNIKESKALKIFHTALVDFVKDLLKPWWREGQLSKDAHKTIVKKSVEKVLSTLQSHQIPSTQEAINQYLTTSRPKILRLVEGYAQKHANS